MWVWGSDVPVFGGDEVLDEFDHCDGFAELSCDWNCTVEVVCRSQLLEATLTQARSRVLY